jgi:hypothetical protein
MPVYINPTQRAVTFVGPLGQVFNVSSGTSVIYPAPAGTAGEDTISDTILHTGNGAGYSKITAVTASVIAVGNLGPNCSGTTLNNVSIAANESLNIALASLQLTSGIVVAQRL